MEAGYLLRLLQEGEALGLPWSRPMPSIGPRCHELRVNDLRVTWRIMYHVDADCVVILGVYEKKTQKTPRSVIDVCGRRLRKFLADSGE